MFGYGPEHTSFNPTESAISVGNVAGLIQRYPPSDGNGCGIAGNQPEVPERVCSSPAVANGSVYVGTASGDLVARDAGTGNLQWSGHTGAAISSSPAVVDGVVYVGSDDSKLYAFDAAGTINCSGSPKTCAPLWTANAMTRVRSSPTVANGVVYVATVGVLAFSAAGTTNCSGSPKVCNPLWATTLTNSRGRTPAIANGVLYVSADQLYAYDAAGTINCSGTPKLCAPLWTGPAVTGTMQTPPAVANEVVYVGMLNSEPFSGSFLEAFSAAGTTNCSESPKVCKPLWVANLPQVTLNSTPAIANGVVYISTLNFLNAGSLLAAFDAAGVKNCSPPDAVGTLLGAGAECTPLWTVEHQLNDVWASWSPAIANGVVYVSYQSIVTPWPDISTYAVVEAFDATGTTNCSGTPKTCSPLWSDLVAARGGGLSEVSSPVVANGAVYLNAGAIYKYALPS